MKQIDRNPICNMCNKDEFFIMEPSPIEDFKICQLCYEDYDRAYQLARTPLTKEERGFPKQQLELIFSEDRDNPTVILKQSNKIDSVAKNSLMRELTVKLKQLLRFRLALRLAEHPQKAVDDHRVDHRADHQ